MPLNGKKFLPEYLLYPRIKLWKASAPILQKFFIYATSIFLRFFINKYYNNTCCSQSLYYIYSSFLIAVPRQIIESGIPENKSGIVEMEEKLFFYHNPANEQILAIFNYFFKLSCSDYYLFVSLLFVIKTDRSLPAQHQKLYKELFYHSK